MSAVRVREHRLLVDEVRQLGETNIIVSTAVQTLTIDAVVTRWEVTRFRALKANASEVTSAQRSPGGINGDHNGRQRYGRPASLRNIPEIDPGPHSSRPGAAA